MEKIPGPALCGFADVFEGEELIGAKATAKPHKSGGPAPAPTPRLYPKAKQSSTIAKHVQALTNARKVLAKAHGTVKTAAKKTLAKPTQVVSRVSPAARAAAVSRGRSNVVAVRGDDYVILGAAPPPQTPKVKKALAKLTDARAKAKKLAGEAATKTKTAHGTIVKLAQQVKAHENVARRLSGKTVSAPTGKRSGVHGYIGSDAYGLLPGDPGYDPTTEDGTNGPAGTASGAGLDAGIDPNTGASTSPQLDVDTLVAAAKMAPIPIDKYIADTTGLPIIKYDGSKGAPDGYVLSYGLATRDTDIYCEPNTAAIDGTAHFGYCWKTYPSRVGGIPWGEDMGDQGWNHLHGRHWFSEGGWSTPVSPDEAFQSYSKQVDISLPGARVHGYVAGVARNASYGPLIGNPTMKDFVNMRVDAQGNMFWLANEAPDYITAPLKAAAALTQAAADKAAKDAAAAAAAAQAKAAADAAAALAAQEAQNALDEANAASQQRQATSQAQAQADQADADLARQDAAQAALDAQERQQDLQYAQQQQQLDLQYQQQQAPLDIQAQQQALAQQQWEFQQQQQQAQLDFQAQQAALAQQQQQAQWQAQQQALAQQYGQPQPPPDVSLPPTAEDAAELDPEAAADAEAAQIEADADVLGAVLGTSSIAGDEAVIGGDGNVIGIDQWGNATD